MPNEKEHRKEQSGVFQGTPQEQREKKRGEAGEHAAGVDEGTPEGQHDRDKTAERSDERP